MMAHDFVLCLAVSPTTMVVTLRRGWHEPALVALVSLVTTAVVSGQPDMVELCALNPQAYEDRGRVCPWTAGGDPTSLTQL